MLFLVLLIAGLLIQNKGKMDGDKTLRVVGNIMWIIGLGVPLFYIIVSFVLSCFGI